MNRLAYGLVAVVSLCLSGLAQGAPPAPEAQKAGIQGSFYLLGDQEEGQPGKEYTLENGATLGILYSFPVGIGGDPKDVVVRVAGNDGVLVPEKNLMMRSFRPIVGANNIVVFLKAAKSGKATVLIDVDGPGNAEPKKYNFNVTQPQD